MTLDLLRFTTAGSVDDGKSTLIGRLLYDSKQIFDDQLQQVAQASIRRGGEGALDLALLTDGLRAEREQGITIDVAYRYFATPRRRFIIADCPGHQQYTRNMVTGASTADLAIILLDARRGVLEQSKRHAFISCLLGIPHLVVAINKMDLVGYSQSRFQALREDFEDFASGLPRTPDIAYIPISALDGDNVVDASSQMGWYEGAALLDLLETVEVAYDHPAKTTTRFPVQWVIRPSGQDGPPDYRGYAGQLSSGSLHPGDRVLAVPSERESRIEAIDSFDGPLAEALAPMSVTLLLEDDLDISRGDMICHADKPPTTTRELYADVCWFSDRDLCPDSRYVIKHTSRSAVAVVDEICDVVDVHTLDRLPSPPSLALNDIGRVHLRTSIALAVDPYASNRRTGSFILIDESTNETVGAGMISPVAEVN